MAENRAKHRKTGKTAGDNGGRWRMIEDNRGRVGTVGDGGGGHNVIRPRPGAGRTDCPVANTVMKSAEGECVD